MSTLSSFSLHRASWPPLHTHPCYEWVRCRHKESGRGRISTYWISALHHDCAQRLKLRLPVSPVTGGEIDSGGRQAAV